MAFVTDKKRKMLELNPNVKSVSGSNVSYTSEFITDALRRYKSGQSANEIWEAAGFDVSLFAKNYCSKAITRWLAKEKAHGEESFGEERRGRKTGQRFSSLEEENAYLRAENAFLKELRALEKPRKK